MSEIAHWIELGSRFDAWAVIEALVRLPDPLQAGREFVALMRNAYWKNKDLTAALRSGQAGATFAFAAAAGSADQAKADQLRGIAKGLLYDVASFAWPGWDEPGIAITLADIAAGRVAADANLRLARELKKGDLPTSRAHWMVGGYHLCAHDYLKAVSSYRDGADHAKLAGSRADELLCLGFIQVSEILQKGAALTDSTELVSMRAELSSLADDGPMFDGQIETAYRVFAASPSSSSAVRHST